MGMIDWERDQSTTMGEGVKWGPELEVALFHSMHGHKPAGLNKYFHMACIQHRLQQSTDISISAEQIWAHLRTLYDIQSLDEFERFPFPNEEQEFALPDHFFAAAEPAEKSSQVADGEILRRAPRQSSSPSPASSPLSRTATKRKRN